MATAALTNGEMENEKCVFYNAGALIIVKRWYKEASRIFEVTLSVRVLKAFRASNVLSVLDKVLKGQEVRPSVWILKEYYGYVIRTPEKDVRLVVYTLDRPVHVVYQKLFGKGQPVPMFDFDPECFFRLMTTDFKQDELSQLLEKSLCLQ